MISRILDGMFRRKNKGAFQGEMTCPLCSRQSDPTSTPIGFESDEQKIILKEQLGPFIRVYKCLHCGGEWRYDVNPRQTDPYSSFTRGLKKNVKLPGLKYSGRVPLLKDK